MKVVIFTYNLTCFFMGHHNAPEAAFPLLRQSIERLIAGYGAISFVVGNRDNFDAMAAKAVSQAKQSRPDNKLSLLLTYPQALPPGFDGVVYPPEIEAISSSETLNRYMIDTSDFLIAYALGGSTARLCQYAYERERQSLLIVENLAQGKLRSI